VSILLPLQCTMTNVRAAQMLVTGLNTGSKQSVYQFEKRRYEIGTRQAFRRRDGLAWLFARCRPRAVGDGRCNSIDSGGQDVRNHRV